MMRHNQARAARRATRKAIYRDRNSGLVSIIRDYNRAILVVTLAALFASIVLLFIGTFAYFESSSSSSSSSSSRHVIDERHTSGLASNNANATADSVYATILSFYGIDESHFATLFPAHHFVSASASINNNNNNINNNKNNNAQINDLHQHQRQHHQHHHLDHLDQLNRGKILNYRIGVSMMFVAGVSIFVEIGLVCAILFENFKLSLLYASLLIGSLAYGLLATPIATAESQLAPPTSSPFSVAAVTSIAFQCAYTVAFTAFAAGIVVKRKAADSIAAKLAAVGGKSSTHISHAAINDNRSSIQLVGGNVRLSATSSSSTSLFAAKEAESKA